MKCIKDISIAILVGGMGSRLRPAVENKPKAMAPINGKPFLSYLFNWLILQGAQEVVLCTGYKGEQIRDYFTEQYQSLHIKYSHEKIPLGTAGALRLSMSKVKSDHILAINGDTFCDANLNDYISWYKDNQYNAAILLAYMKDVLRFGSVVTDRQGYVASFSEKVNRYAGGYVSAGIYLLNRNIIEQAPQGCALSMEYDVLPGLVGKGLAGFKTRSSFIDIGTPDSFNTAQSYFESFKFEAGE